MRIVEILNLRLRRSLGPEFLSGPSLSPPFSVRFAGEGVLEGHQKGRRDSDYSRHPVHICGPFDYVSMKAHETPRSRLSTWHEIASMEQFLAIRVSKFRCSRMTITPHLPLSILRRHLYLTSASPTSPLCHPEQEAADDRLNKERR